MLDMRRTDPAGEDLPPDTFVFGNAIGQRVRDVGRAWETAVLLANGIALAVTKTGNLTPECRAAYKRINLHLHDLRREAGSRWLDAGIPLHQVQAWLGHTNISQTSTYLAVPEGDGFALMERFERRRAEMLQETCKLEGESWSGREDSNLRPLGPEPSALPG